MIRRACECIREVFGRVQGRTKGDFEESENSKFSPASKQNIGDSAKVPDRQGSTPEG